MTYTDIDRPCSQCPFRRSALPGWLGPWKPQELLHSLVMSPFPCHKTIQGGEDFSAPNLRGCAGAAFFLNNKAELSRCPETAAHQAVLDKDIENVFQWPDEFTNHHERNEHVTDSLRYAVENRNS